MPYIYIIVFDSHGIDNLYFEPLSQLKYLDLSNCKMDALPEQIFRENTMLEELRKENIKAMFPSYNYYIQEIGFYILMLSILLFVLSPDWQETRSKLFQYQNCIP